MCGSKDLTGNSCDDNNHNPNSGDDALDNDDVVDVSDANDVNGSLKVLCYFVEQNNSIFRNQLEKLKQQCTESLKEFRYQLLISY